MLMNGWVGDETEVEVRFSLVKVKVGATSAAVAIDALDAVPGDNAPPVAMALTRT
jgi:hypothetical protein